MLGKVFESFRGILELAYVTRGRSLDFMLVSIES
jgi:hypothetical protein